MLLKAGSISCVVEHANLARPNQRFCHVFRILLLLHSYFEGVKPVSSLILEVELGFLLAPRKMLKAVDYTCKYLNWLSPANMNLKVRPLKEGSAVCFVFVYCCHGSVLFILLLVYLFCRKLEEKRFDQYAKLPQKRYCMVLFLSPQGHWKRIGTNKKTRLAYHLYYLTEKRLDPIISSAPVSLVAMA